MTEAERLMDMYEDCSLSDFVGEERVVLKRIYDRSRNATTGSTIVCPVCKTSHKKTTYHKVFCGVKKRGSSTCKDQYWNIISDDRLDRALHYGKRR